jgi:signal transduction histidine kinase
LEALLREFGLGVTLIVVFVGALLAAGKWALPRLLDAYLKRAEFQATEKAKASEEQREQAAEAAAADRQEEITLVSQVVALQTRLVRQNDELIKFMTETIAASLNGIKLAIDDIDQRWLSVSGEMGERSMEHRRLEMSITAMIEALRRMEERHNSLIAYKAVNEEMKSVGGREVE